MELYLDHTVYMTQSGFEALFWGGEYNSTVCTQDLNFYDDFVNILVRFKLRSRGVAVNMPACHAGDRGFKSHRLRQI